MTDSYNLDLVEPRDLLEHLRTLVRLARQGAGLTQGDLAHKAGVPATTISRIERTGLASTDTLARVLFALNEIDALAALLSGRVRQWRVLSGETRPRQRIRHA